MNGNTSDAHHMHVVGNWQNSSIAGKTGNRLVYGE
jgi:hypothetical protein